MSMLRIDLTLRHGVHRDAKAAHNLLMLPCQNEKSNTLYFQHDLGGTRFTVTTDDLGYDVSAWGNRCAEVMVRPFTPQYQAGMTREFRIRLNRQRRSGHQGLSPYSTEEELDRLLLTLLEGDERLGRPGAGVEILEHRIRYDESVSLNAPADGQRGRGTMPSATFDGLLRVMNPERLHEALCRGIGRGKRHGCGMLMLRKPLPLE